MPTDKPWQQVLAFYETQLERLYEQARDDMRKTAAGALERYWFIRRLGAATAALGKRARRMLILAYLVDARDSGLDITPTVALRFAQHVIGRGLMRTELNKVFGTPGRTASDKSSVTQEELAGLEEWVKADMARLVAGMDQARNKLKRKFSGDWS